MDEKERVRKMYGFEPGEAFDLFYDGLFKLLSSLSEKDCEEAKQLFDKSIEKDPTNKHTHIFRAVTMKSGREG